ncbi:MAG: T9SS type A sorting domain-containing protein, partial [Bacteroidota bacterium]
VVEGDYFVDFGRHVGEGDFVFGGVNPSSRFSNFNNNTFYNVEVNLSASDNLLLMSNGALVATNRLTLTQGGVSTISTTLVEDTVYVASGFGGISGSLSFRESGNGYFITEGELLEGTSILIEKNSSLDTVFFQPAAGFEPLVVGGASDRLDVVSGVLDLDDFRVTFSYDQIQIYSNSTLMASSDTLGILGDLTNSGQLKPNGGTIALEGGDSTRIQNTGVLRFQNLTIDKPTSGVRFVNGISLPVAGGYRVVDGGIKDGTLQVLGDLVFESGFDGSNTSLVLIGVPSQDFSVFTADRSYGGDIQLSKDGNGTVSLTTPLALDVANTSLILQRGVLHTTASSLLTIGDDVMVSAAAASYVEGPVRKLGDEGFVFPVGAGGSYAPISISSTTDRRNEFTAQYFAQNPQSAGYDVGKVTGAIQNVGQCEYWELEGTEPVIVTLSWESRSCGVSNPSEMLVAHWDETNGEWVDEGQSRITGDASSGTVSSDGTVRFFSPFTLASSSADNPLPVDLEFFRGKSLLDKAELVWRTAQERNNDFFTLEKSRDGERFEHFRVVAGAGTSLRSVEYGVVDHTPYFPMTYYRLSQTDWDGATESFDVIAVRFGLQEAKQPKVFPTPATEAYFSVELPFDAVGKGGELWLSDMTGRQMFTLSWEAGTQSIVEVPIGNLRSGTYVLQIDWGGDQFVTRLPIVK